MITGEQSLLRVKKL
jgi:hypothetical protein